MPTPSFAALIMLFFPAHDSQSYRKQFTASTMPTSTFLRAEVSTYSEPSTVPLPNVVTYSSTSTPIT